MTDQPTLDEAASAYAAAHADLTAQHARAMAASQAYTEARNAARDAPDWQRHKAHLDAGAAKDAMGKAWKRADTAMHAEWAARDALCAAAVAACAAPTLFDADATTAEQAA